MQQRVKKMTRTYCYNISPLLLVWMIASSSPVSSFVPKNLIPASFMSKSSSLGGGVGSFGGGAAANEHDSDDDSATFSARALLYQDLQNARARAAEEEGFLLKDRVTPLEAPYETTLDGAMSSPAPAKKWQQNNIASSTSGSGFGGAAAKTKKKKSKKTWIQQKKKYKDMTPKEKQAFQQAAVLRRDGCLRIDGALKKTTAARVKACILQEIDNANQLKLQHPDMIAEINAQHGIDQERTSRCVINLPLRADKIKHYEQACTQADPTYDASDDENNSSSKSDDPIVNALEELLDPQEGSLGPLWAELCGETAPLYEICSLVTWPGSLRQSVHPDAAYQPHPPLFAAFIATQDITPEMGPTQFLPGTHLPTPMRLKYDVEETRCEMISEFPTPKEALLKAGDLAIFDMRCLHVGQANQSHDSTRVLFNLTFRNPAADQPIGYDGSIRNHYFEKFTLNGMQKELERGKASGDAFANVA